MIDIAMNRFSCSTWMVNQPIRGNLDSIVVNSDFYSTVYLFILFENIHRTVGIVCLINFLRLFLIQIFTYMNYSFKQYWHYSMLNVERLSLPIVALKMMAFEILFSRIYKMCMTNENKERQLNCFSPINKYSIGNHLI